jgi:hypothetical protein
MKRLHVEVNGPLETAVVHEVGPEIGPRLVQVLVRSLVWWLSVPGDLRRGDVLEALYEERPGEDPIVYAVRYKSGKASNRPIRSGRASTRPTAPSSSCASRMRRSTTTSR